MNYASTANIEEVMKFYNLGHKTFEADFNYLQWPFGPCQVYQFYSGLIEHVTKFSALFIVQYESALKTETKTVYRFLVPFPFQRYDHVKFWKSWENCLNKIAPFCKNYDVTGRKYINWLFNANVVHTSACQKQIKLSRKYKRFCLHNNTVNSMPL